MFTESPIPRRWGPPSSNTPLKDHLDDTELGVDTGYVVLPRNLIESMPLRWQQTMVHLLSDLHEVYGYLSWPTYQVIPSRHELLTNLDDDQLAEIGCTVEVGDDGALEYRTRSGDLIEDPETHSVLVSCLDPIPPHPEPAAVQSQFAVEQEKPEDSTPT